MRIPALTALALLATASTYAAELEDFAGVFGKRQSGLIFHYTSPMEGFHRDSPTLQGPSDYALMPFLMDAQGVDPWTGLDFTRVTGVLTAGDPPNDALVLFGGYGFADDMRDTLLARNFEKRRIAGMAALGLGEDNAIDLHNARQPDPFAGGMGRAQRVALADDFIAVTPNWSTLGEVLESLEAEGGTTAIWQASFAALAEQMGESHLDSAWGWGADSFMMPSMDMILAPDADMNELAANFAEAGQLNFPPFPFALLALTRSEDGAALRIALPYGDRQSAEAALDYVGHTLVQFPDVPESPEEVIVERDTLFIATLSLTYTVEDAAQANKLMLDWNAAIMARNFAPLQFIY